MNLPDDLSAKKKSQMPGVSLNDEIINDMKKKNLLNRINSKFADKSAAELHDMKLVMPQQQEMNDDDINELLNEGD